jgi:hypothetical protein
MLPGTVSEHHPMSKAQLSLVVGRIGIALLIFFLLVAIAGFVASNDSRRKIAAFAADSQTVMGTVTNRYTQVSASNVFSYVEVDRNEVHLVDVSFQSEDGRFHYDSTPVAGRLYDGLRVGNPIRVTYVRSNPDLFYVADELPTDRDASVFVAMFEYGTLAFLLLLIVLAAYVFWDRGQGTPVDQIANEQSKGSSLRAQLGRGFGARRRF